MMYRSCCRPRTRHRIADIRSSDNGNGLPALIGPTPAHGTLGVPNHDNRLDHDRHRDAVIASTI